MIKQKRGEDAGKEKSKQVTQVETCKSLELEERNDRSVPAGSCASRQMRASRKAVAEVSSEGLQTTALPAASAGAILNVSR